MSKLAVQEMRRASGSAIAELDLPAATTRSLATAVSDMAGAELKGPLLEAVNESDRRLSIAADMAHIVGTILTHPHIKLPANKFDSPQNRQLIREVTAKLVDPERRLEVSIGIGGSEDPPSLRFPAYVSPALDIAQAFLRRHAAPPVVRIYNAHEVSSSINGLDAAVAVDRARQAKTLIGNFAAVFYPDVASSLEQPSVKYTELQAKGFAEDTAELLRILHLPSAELSQDEQAVRAQLEKLRRASSKHAGQSADEAEAIIAGYAAAHGLTFHNYGEPAVDGVIKLGGQGEAPFDAIQQYMACAKYAAGVAISNASGDGTPQLINLRMKAGVLPPYYLERDAQGNSEELTMDSLASDIPSTTEAIIHHYAGSGLRTGIDFTLLPDDSIARLPHFLRECVG